MTIFIWAVICKIDLIDLSFVVSDFIQSLISQKKRLEAVRFIYAFELVDKFPPVPLLQDHLNDAKKASRTVWKNSKSSSKEKVDLAVLLHTTRPKVIPKFQFCFIWNFIMNRAG